MCKSVWPLAHTAAALQMNTNAVDASAFGWKNSTEAQKQKLLIHNPGLASLDLFIHTCIKTKAASEEKAPP